MSRPRLSGRRARSDSERGGQACIDFVGQRRKVDMLAQADKRIRTCLPKKNVETEREEFLVRAGEHCRSEGGAF